MDRVVLSVVLFMFAGFFLLGFALVKESPSLGRGYRGPDPHYFRQRPAWVLQMTQLLFAFFIVNFAILLYVTRGGAPQMRHGQYVLNQHGSILAILTPEQYARMKRTELRSFASFWIICYFSLCSYWWYPKIEG